MNYTNTTDPASCFGNNLVIITPIFAIFFTSIVFNIISGTFWCKYRRERKKRRRRVLEMRKARNRKKKKFSEKNLEYQVYVKRDNSSVPEWAYNQYMEDSIM